MIDAPENSGGGLECLKIVNDKGLGEIIGELQAQVDRPEVGRCMNASTKPILIVR